MKISILEYDYKNDGTFRKHRAVIETVDPFESEYYLAVHTAIKAGYHPAGYGIYKWNVKKIDENKYEVNWESSRSSD